VPSSSSQPSTIPTTSAVPSSSSQPSTIPTISGMPSYSVSPSEVIPPPVSCISGETRVFQSAGRNDDGLKFKYVRDLTTRDRIQGLNKNFKEVTCTVEAVGNFGFGPVHGNYTEDHFVLDPSSNTVRFHGPVGPIDHVKKFAVLTSCPVGLDETGVGFTPVDSDFIGEKSLAWSDYVLVHQSILKLVRRVGPFVFSPSTYISMGDVERYTNRFYKTMLNCAKDPNTCNSFERAAEVLVENALTDEAKLRVKSVLFNLGRSRRLGSVSSVVTDNRSLSSKVGDTRSFNYDKPLVSLKREEIEDAAAISSNGDGHKVPQLLNVNIDASSIIDEESPEVLTSNTGVNNNLVSDGTLEGGGDTEDTNQANTLATIDHNHDMTIKMPSAQPVEDEDPENVVKREDSTIIATDLEPTIPWRSQKRTRTLLGLVLVILVALTISLGIWIMMKK